MCIKGCCERAGFVFGGFGEWGGIGIVGRGEGYRLGYLSTKNWEALCTVDV